MATNEELKLQLADAQRKINELQLEKTNSKKQIEIKVSDKGCVQINGIRRFPITFYKNELKTIFDMKNDLENFMNIHSNDLKSK